MKISIFKKAIAVLGLFVATSVFNLANAEVAVIVHPSNDSALSDSDIKKIYLGKSRNFSNGATAVAVDLPEGTATRVAFIDAIVEKSETQFKSYWSRLIFTGKGIPPKILQNDAEVVDLVSRNPDVIGFVDTSSVNDSVKVVLTK